MTNDQIISLDKCRDLKRQIKKADGEIKVALNQLIVGANSNKGKELSELVEKFRLEVINSYIEIDKGIDLLIRDI